MRKMLAMLTTLAGIGALLFDLQSFKATAQPQAVYWIPDDFAANGGKGVYQLTSEGQLSLIIPYSRIKAGFVDDIAVDQEGQIFLLVDGRRIYKATPSGEVTLVVKEFSFVVGNSLAIDAQGNFIITQGGAGRQSNSIYRLSPKGGAPKSVGRADCAGSLIVENTGDYVMLAGCEVSEQRLIRINPATGEVTKLLEYDPRLGRFFDFVKNPLGDGYLLLSCDEDAFGVIMQLSSGGVLASLYEHWGEGCLQDAVLGPSGTLYAITLKLPADVIQYFPDGSRKVWVRLPLATARQMIQVPNQ